MEINLLTGTLIGLVAVAAVLIVILLWMDRGRSVHHDEPDRQARLAVAEHERQVRLRRAAERAPLSAEDMLQRGARQNIGPGADGM